MNLVELEILLARFDIGLDEFASTLGVTRAELARANVSLRDLEQMGLSLERLQQVGITIDDLRRIGVDVSSAD